MSVVMKFGGTSVADADAMKRLTAIVRRQIDRQRNDGAAGARPPIVVVSALSKVTDGLLEVARLIEHGDREGAMSRLEALVDRHLTVASGVFSAGRLDPGSPGALNVISLRLPKDQLAAACDPENLARSLPWPTTVD